VISTVVRSTVSRDRHAEQLVAGRRQAGGRLVHSSTSASRISALASEIALALPAGQAAGPRWPTGLR